MRSVFHRSPIVSGILVEDEDEWGGQSAITSIAIQCPSSGGPAVYRARTLVGLFNDSIDYQNACIQILGNRTPGTKFPDVQSKVIVTPNPAMDYVVIKVHSQNTRLVKIELANPVGQVLMTQIILENTQHLQLDVTGFPQGFYTIRCHLADQSIDTQKLIIVR